MTPILFIPGFMLDHDLWADVESLLVPIRPIMHAEMRDATSIPDLARRALAAAPCRFSLVGFSMGGYVAREMVRMAPGRVDRLILIATSARPDSEPQRRAKQAAKIDPGRFHGISRASIRQALAHEREDEESLVERVRRMSLRLGGETYRRQSGFRRGGDGDRLAVIACPTLIVAGRHDRLRSLAEAEELRDGIPGAQLAVLPVGHLIPLEAPWELAQLLRAFFAGATSAVTP